MKKMKTTIAVALAACATTQVFAQVKEDVITFSLTGQKQTSISTSATALNAGNWSQEPHYYKTGTTKVTQADIIKFIAAVKHMNPNYYSTSAKLVLVQGELSGFFNVTPDLGNSLPHNHNLDGNAATAGIDGWFYTSDTDATTDIANSTDSAFVTMANGHHLQINNFDNGNLYPVGHLQPWGQIFIKDTAKSGFSVANPLCENVTYYFAMSVEECYDCFYMNSFVSDAAFSVKNNQHQGPNCCGTSSTLLGKGKDRYYLTLSFDNTANNPYLNAVAAENNNNSLWTGDRGFSAFDPASPTGANNGIPGDGLVYDQVNFGDANPTYFDEINHSWSSKWLAFEARFTLNGILTYNWNLKFVSASDLAPDFVGVGSYAASGYGFVSLWCQLFTGSATFTESVTAKACCLDNNPWWDNSGDNQGWYGVGAEYYETPDPNNVGSYILDQTKYMAGQYQSPMNVGASLTYHHNFDMNYGWAMKEWGAGWPTPAVITPYALQAGGVGIYDMYDWDVYYFNQGY